MKIKPAYVLATLICIFIAAWFIYGTKAKNKADEIATTIAPKEAETLIPSVEIRTIHPQLHDSFIDLHARSEAVREVAVKAETPGLVVATPVREGRLVTRGTTLCRQDIDARQAVLDQANAVLRTRQVEYEAAQKLVDRGFRSPTQALGAAAARDGAKASVKQAEIEIGNVIMRAPFNGIFEQQMAEIGDYLAPGQPCGLLVDLDPLIIAGEATENQIGNIKVGGTAKVSLMTGQNLDGKVRYIESRANPATRTFRIEVEVPNKKSALKAGVTASLRLPAGQKNAHLIPSHVLTLNDTGQIGVRYLDSESRVRFTQIVTLEETPEGIWVSGLPDGDVNLIVLGQDYVSEGTFVHTQYDIPAQSDTSSN